VLTEPLTIERLEGTPEKQGVLRLKGPLTMENIMPFQNAVRREGATTIILDLSGVPYVDSFGLGSLVSAFVSCQKAGRRVVLSGVNERVLKLFEITRVQSLFPIFVNLSEAILALAGAAEA
jgi:anti-sigma B factor antagonist